MKVDIPITVPQENQQDQTKFVSRVEMIQHGKKDIEFSSVVAIRKESQPTETQQACSMLVAVIRKEITDKICDRLMAAECGIGSAENDDKVFRSGLRAAIVIVRDVTNTWGV